MELLWYNSWTIFDIRGYCHQAPLQLHPTQWPNLDMKDGGALLGLWRNRMTIVGTIPFDFINWVDYPVLRSCVITQLPINNPSQ